ncbi:MAG: prolyl oligopeptidase family serine peptidase, partial [Sphingomonadales bacterium]|nr:prolyl oligopeptidase family serine peptidase [Sphingomonadales bacterium]
YPEIFLMTSTRDERVHPGNARKMAAKMIAQGHPVLFYETAEGGHSLAVDSAGRAFNAAMQLVYLQQKLMDGMDH